MKIEISLSNEDCEREVLWGALRGARALVEKGGENDLRAATALLRIVEAGVFGPVDAESSEVAKWL